MSDADFTLKIRVGSELGVGFVELHVGDERHIISSVDFDEGVSVEESETVSVVAVPSRGNEFVSWGGSTGWLGVLDKGVLNGVASADLELTVEFDEVPEVVEPELVLPELEVIEPEYSSLNANVIGGRGVISIDFGGKTRLVTSSDMNVFSVPVGEIVRVGLIPDEGYVLSTTTGFSGTFEMGHESVHISTSFVEEEIVEDPEPDEDDEDVVEELVPPADKFLFGEGASVSFKGMGEVALPSKSKEVELAPRDLVYLPIVEFTLDYDETLGVVVSRQTGGPDQRLMNARFIDLVFVEHYEYRFILNDPRAMIEIVDMDGDLVAALDDDSHEHTETEFQYGVFNNAFSTGGDPIIIRPNSNTPRELIYRERFPRQEELAPTPPPTYDQTGIPTEFPLRRRHEHASYGRIHVSSEIQSGRVCGYGYIEEAVFDFLSEFGDLTETSTRDHEHSTRNPGIFSWLVVGDYFSSLETYGGFDYMTQTDNNVTYKTVGRTLTLNAFTTVFSAIYDSSDLDVSEINKYFCGALNFSDSYDILNQDPLHEISRGRTQYLDIYKKLVQLNILLDMTDDGEGTEQELLSRLSTVIVSGRKIDLTANQGAMITELMTGTFDGQMLTSVHDLLSVIFTYIEEITGSTSDQLDELFKVGRVCSGPVRTAILSGSSGDIDGQKAPFDDNVLADETAKSYPLPTRLPLHMVSACEDIGLKTIFGSHITKELDEDFVEFLTGVSSLTIETMSVIYGKTLMLKYYTTSACYGVLEVPSDFIDYQKQLEPVIDSQFLPVSSYSGGDEVECCNDVPAIKFTGDEDVPATENVFSFKLVEGGESNVMYEKTVTNKSHPIEYLGNDEYRIYLDETVTAGSLDESSPGYFVVPKTYATQMEQRYLKVVYNSTETVRTVSQVSYDDILMTSTYVYGTGWNYDLGDASTEPSAIASVTIMFASEHGLENGATVRFKSTSDTFVEFDNKEHMVSVATLWSLTVTFQVDLDAHPSINNTIQSFHGVFNKISPSDTGMVVNVVTESLARVFHSGESYKVGDTVVFDQLCKGRTFNVLEVGDVPSTHCVIDETLPPGISKVVKSHVNDELTEVIDFMYVTHMQYYEVAGVTYPEDRLWLSYDPDTSPEGRAGHKVSYVQFFHNEL